MPSVEENRARVKDSLDQQKDDVDHDAILASLQGEIDRHNKAKADLRQEMRQSKTRGHESTDDSATRSTRFRFKDGVKESKRKRSHHHRDRDGRKRTGRDYSTPPEEEAAHPFPREPADPLRPDIDNTDHAFRESLFDALADDEGATYWEGVYSQPIHVYSRPTVRTEEGGLEQMGDDEYAEYVKRRMWEKKNPEIVLERQRRARKEEEEGELRRRRRERFLRERGKEAWARSQRAGMGESGSEEERYEPTVPLADGSGRESERCKEDVWKVAWATYLCAWDDLKRQLLDEAARDGASAKTDAALRMPWPVLSRKPVVKANIEAFMQHIPATDGESRLRALKAERVRWHPDKIQQRFGGTVDAGTMKLVTGVFQVIDARLEEERRKVQA